MLPILFGALGVFGAAALFSSEDEDEYGAVSYSMGGRGRGAGQGTSTGMGGRSSSRPYDWDTASGTALKWDRPGAVYGDVEPDLNGANTAMNKVVADFGGRVLDQGKLQMSGVAPAFYTEAAFPSFGVANRALVQSKAVAKANGAEGDCVWLFAGPNRFVILWSKDDALYFERWWNSLNAAKGKTLKVKEVFSDSFGFVLLGIPFGKESRIESLTGKIEKATAKIASLEADAKKEGADKAKLAKKIARYEQKMERWEGILEKIDMGDGPSFGHDGEDEDEDIFGKDDYFPPDGEYGSEIDSLLEDDSFGQYDILGDRISREMFGMTSHGGHQRTAILIDDHVI